MAGTGSDDLYSACVDYLAACYAALADTPAGPPSRYYVSPGPPAYDCEQLTVYAGGPAVADTFPLQPMLAPGHRVNVQGKVNLLAITATIIRCVPIVGENGEYPDPIDMNTAARQTNADLWAIWNHVGREKRAGTLYPPKERELFFDPAVAINQQGGFGGWAIQIRVALEGYSP